jgi:hypothetical protein
MAKSDQQLTLLILGTASIQSYIFGSNRLKENIGASYLVKQVTEEWAVDALKRVAPRANTDENPNQKIEEGDLDAEVLYAGGGNFVVLFREEETAKHFVETLSKKVLIDAPGLRLDVDQCQFLWEVSGTGLGKAVGNLIKNQKKNRSLRRASAPLLGLGVTAVCQSTGLPATKIISDSDGKRRVSAEVAAKNAAAEKANKSLHNVLPLDEGYVYPSDLDQLGRTVGERSYIAIVHADGNGMGEIIRQIGEIENNRLYIEEMRKYSKQVTHISKNAMLAVIKRLIQATVEDDKIAGVGPVADLKFSVDEHHGLRLPIRPIVFGGDDTTFVCDGRLGLSLAAMYLREFENAAKQLGRNFSASAGVAIVKSRYPFARAYQLSEDLCGVAKKFRYTFSKPEEVGGTLDWYFTSGGLYDELEEMRKREYTAKSGSLTLRPVTLGNEGGVRSWGTVKRLTSAFQNEWKDKRNKAKALRDALREGPEAVERFLKVYEQKLPTLDGFSATGWNEKQCGYFDALELMDIYIPLDSEKEA